MTWTRRYRKSLVPVQMTIIVVCLALLFLFHVPPLTVVIYAAIMEVFAVVGAMWAVRLTRKLNPDPDKPKLRSL